MRTLSVLLLLLTVGCTGAMKPAVIPTLSELPPEPERRNKVLDSAHARPGPENQPTSKKARKVETAAATAAAILGVILSDHANVTLGASSTFDENQLFEDRQPNKPKTKPAATEAKPDGPLVPWIRLAPTPETPSGE